MQKQETLWITDMTCRQCEHTLTRALLKLPGVSKVKADYSSGELQVTYEEKKCDLTTIKKTIEKTGYSLGKRKQNAGNIAAMVIFLLGIWYILKTLGVTTLFAEFPAAEKGMSYAALFLIGLLTSVHCIAMCGGINLAQSMGKNNSGPLLPSVCYNLGRLLSYTAVGALLGGIGSAIAVSVEVRAVLGILVGIIMLCMGLRMLKLFPQRKLFWVPKWFPVFKGIPLPFWKSERKAEGNARSSFYLGMVGGLMPCGPLQTMQLLAIAEGSVGKGAMSMFFFCLGTVPLMLFFGIFVGAMKQKWKEKMMIAGPVLILFFAVSMLQNNVALLGIGGGTGEPQKQTAAVSEEGSTEKDDAVTETKEGKIQYITTNLRRGGYDAIEVTQGIPVEWTIVADKGTLNGCNGRLYIPAFDLAIELTEGENLISFLPQEAGTYSYSCWMGMLRSSIRVVEAS